MERSNRPEDLKVAVLFLRALRGWEQKDLADAAGLAPSTISRYESGELVPSPEALGEIAQAVGLSGPMLARVLSVIRAARASLESVRAPGDERLWIHARASLMASEVADSMYTVGVGLLTSLMDRRDSPAPLRTPRAEDRQEAEEAWERLKGLSPPLRQTSVENFEEFQTWALCERICAESLEAENLDEALELAELAREVAERACLEVEWGYRLQGYAWAHVGHARQRSGDPAGAEEAFDRFRELWEKGKRGDTGLLDAERVRRVVEG